jgi:putative transposase
VQCHRGCASAWQLEQSKTGLFINHQHSVLLRLFAEGKLTFPSSIPTHQCVIANDETSPEFELAKVRLSYVRAVLQVPNSQKPMEEAIRIVWDRIKLPEKRPSWTSVYQWRSRYMKKNQDIRALLDNSFNKGNRQSQFLDEVIEICHKSIEARYLSKERNGRREPRCRHPG